MHRVVTVPRSDFPVAGKNRDQDPFAFSPASRKQSGNLNKELWAAGAPWSWEAGCGLALKGEQSGRPGGEAGARVVQAKA